MPTLSLAEFDQRFDEIVERVMRGEEIVVTRVGEAPYRMLPLGPEPEGRGLTGADACIPEDAGVHGVADDQPEESRGW